MRRFATNSPVAYLLSLGICVSLLIQESGAQCLSDCSAHKCCDWWGVRPCLEDYGIEFDAAVTQFYQGVVSGGRERRFVYGGHGDYDLSVDFGKVCRFDGFSLELGAEHRFGETVNRDTGSVIPVALLPNLPDPDTKTLALTKVVLTRELSERVEVFLGKLDTLEYDTNAFADGNGRDRFFSTAFNYNPIATRTVPFSTLGAGFNVMNDAERLFTFLVINTEDTGTTVGNTGCQPVCGGDKQAACATRGPVNNPG